MRTILTASLAAAVTALFMASLSAAPASVAINRNASSLVQLAQYGGGYGGGDHPYHHCPSYYHWACRYDHCRCYHD